MQRPKTYWIRDAVRQILLQKGAMNLKELSDEIGIPIDELRYAIESTMPFGAVFKKTEIDGIMRYSAVSLDEIYGMEDFY